MEEIYSKLQERIMLPENIEIKDKSVRKYTDDLAKVLHKMWRDIVAAVNNNAPLIAIPSRGSGYLSGSGKVNVTTLIFRAPNGHWWKLVLDNTGMADTTDLGVILPEEYR